MALENYQELPAVGCVLSGRVVLSVNAVCAKRMHGFSHFIAFFEQMPKKYVQISIWNALIWFQDAAAYIVVLLFLVLVVQIISL